MIKKLKTIMLVDDDFNTNLYNKIIIKSMNITEQIITFQNGKLALDYLINKDGGGAYPQPDIILLDINMPLMNGWEFIEHYNELIKEQQAQILIAMLTSSINYEDEEKALNSNLVKEFISKPLNKNKINEILEKYFTK